MKTSIKNTLKYTILALLLAAVVVVLVENIGCGRLAEGFQFIAAPSQRYTS